MLILCLVIIAIALYWVSKILGPEMAKSTKYPMRKVARKVAPNPVPDKLTQANEPDNRIEKLEILLTEKNKNILRLQMELSIFLVQVREFDKMKNLLDGEIHRLREQNRIFRSELGMPTVQLKENSII